MTPSCYVRTAGTRWLLSVALCGFIAASAAARTIVVSPTGDDQQTGSADSPVKTISRGAELAQPGDVVLVREGVYRERVAPPRGGEPGRAITYRAAPGERVIVKGSEVWAPRWRSHSGGLYSAVPDDKLFNDRSPEYVDGHNPFKVELASTPWGIQGLREHERRLAGDDRIGETDPRIIYTCGQVFVGGRRFREEPLRERLAPGSWWYDRENNEVYVDFGELDPTGQMVEITTRRRIFAPKKRELGHIVVEGFVFEHCGNQYPTNFWKNDAYAQKGAVGAEAGRHWVIRRNVVRHAKTFAIDIGRVDRHSRRRGSHDNVVEQNYILENGSAGILSSGSRNLVVRDNVILRNNTLRFDGVKRWEQAGVKCHQFDGGRIERNYIADNHVTYGVWLDNQFPDSRVTRNVIVGNGSAGVFLEMSDYGFDRLLVDHNVIVDNGQNAVYIHDASGATFAHNLLANTRPTKGRGQAVYVRQVTARTRTYHHTFRNNLLIGNPRNVEVNYPALRSGAQRFDGNFYHAPAGAREFAINDASDAPSPWSPDEFRDLVLEDLDADGADDGLVFRKGSARMTLEFWRRFWRKHGQENDRRSELIQNARVEYEPATQVLAVDVPRGLASPPLTRPGLTEDFRGDPLPADRPTPPGPFSGLEPGPNRFRVWHGMPLLAEGELPPREWNK